MDQDDLRLSRIDTLWSVVRQAHDGRGNATREAQQVLLDRYGGAVRRYLLASLRNEDAANEVFQEFSLKLVSGAFQKAQAEHGRFRNFLKTTLYHLIVDHQRRGKRLLRSRSLPIHPPAQSDGRLAEEDRAFLRSWRDENTGEGLVGLGPGGENVGHSLPRHTQFSHAHPEMKSPEIAAELRKQLGKPIAAGSVRVLIHRAREMLAERVLDLVLDSLDDPSLDGAEEELIELNLLEYCRSAIQRRRGKPVADTED